jgi:hypothetical protein
VCIMHFHTLIVQLLGLLSYLTYQSVIAQLVYHTRTLYLPVQYITLHQMKAVMTAANYQLHFRTLYDVFHRHYLINVCLIPL